MRGRGGFRPPATVGGFRPPATVASLYWFRGLGGVVVLGGLVVLVDASQFADVFLMTFSL